jgi:hypothetical protein
MRKTHHSRGKGHLASHLGGKRVEQHSDTGTKRKFFGKMAKKAGESDQVGRKIRPAAHNARQSGVAKRARNTVKRLSGQLI